MTSNEATSIKTVPSATIPPSSSKISLAHAPPVSPSLPSSTSPEEIISIDKLSLTSTTSPLTNTSPQPNLRVSFPSATQSSSSSLLGSSLSTPATSSTSSSVHWHSTRLTPFVHPLLENYCNQKGINLENGHYRAFSKFIRKKVGSGGQGQVLLLKLPEFEEKICIKTLKNNTKNAFNKDPERRLLREGKALRYLNDAKVEGIPILYAADFESTRPCITMQYIEGQTLSHIVGGFGSPRNSMQEDEARLVLHHLTKIVANIHDKKMVHRDIKPNNIIWNRSKRNVTLIDFGLSAPLREQPKPLDVEISQDTITTEDTTFKNALIFLPELAKKHPRKRHPGSDVALCSAVYYYLLSGKVRLLFPPKPLWFDRFHITLFMLTMQQNAEHRISMSQLCEYVRVGNNELSIFYKMVSDKLPLLPPSFNMIHTSIARALRHQKKGYFTPVQGRQGQFKCDTYCTEIATTFPFRVCLHNDIFLITLNNEAFCGLPTDWNLKNEWVAIIRKAYLQFTHYPAQRTHDTLS